MFFKLLLYSSRGVFMYQILVWKLQISINKTANLTFYSTVQTPSGKVYSNLSVLNRNRWCAPCCKSSVFTRWILISDFLHFIAWLALTTWEGFFFFKPRKETVDLATLSFFLLLCYLSERFISVWHPKRCPPSLTLITLWTSYLEFQPTKGNNWNQLQIFYLVNLSWSKQASKLAMKLLVNQLSSYFWASWKCLQFLKSGHNTFVKTFETADLHSFTQTPLPS